MGGGGWSSGLPLPVEGAAHTAVDLGTRLVKVVIGHLLCGVSLVLVFGDLSPMGLMWSDGLLATAPRDGWGARPPFTSNGSSLLGGNMRFALPTIIAVTTAALVLSGCGGTDSADGSSTETAKSEVSAKPEAQKLSESGLKPFVEGGEKMTHKALAPIVNGNIPVDEPGKYSASQVQYMQNIVTFGKNKHIPDVSFPGVKPWPEHKDAMESCLAGKGFPETSWGGPEVIPPEGWRENEAWAPAFLECWVNNPLESRYLHPWNEAQKRAYFEHSTTVRYECAKGHGVNVRKPPTFEENESSNPAQRWTIYRTGGSFMTVEQMDDIDEKCPAMTIPDLYSDELLASAE